MAKKVGGCWCRRPRTSNFLLKLTLLAAIYRHSAATQSTTSNITTATYDSNHVEGSITLTTTVKMPAMTLGENYTKTTKTQSSHSNNHVHV